MAEQLTYNEEMFQISNEDSKVDKGKCWFCGKKIKPTDNNDVTFEYGGYRVWSATNTFFKDIPKESLKIKRCKICADIHSIPYTRSTHEELIVIVIFAGFFEAIVLSPLFFSSNREFYSNIITYCLAIGIPLIAIFFYRGLKKYSEERIDYVEDLIKKSPDSKPFEYANEYPAVKKAIEMGSWSISSSIELKGRYG